MITRNCPLVSFHMSGPSSGEIFRQELDSIERTVVEELLNWLVANPNAEWKQSRFNLIEQCSEAKLREILQRLAQVGFYCVFGWRLHADDCRTLVSPPSGRLTRDGNLRKGSSFLFLQAKAVPSGMEKGLIP